MAILVVAAVVPPAAHAAEAVSLEPVGLHGVGLSAGRDVSFALEALVAWGGAGSAEAHRWVELPPATAVIPADGLEQRWQIPSPFTDNFSVRFTGDLAVPADGDYTLYVSSDDGARAWVDEQQVIDAWVPRSGDTSEATIRLTKGTHPIRVEYFEQGGDAQVHVEWKGPGFARQVIPAAAISSGGQSGWKAEYFTNPNLQGEPHAAHHETIDFHWGGGGPEAFGAGPTDVALTAQRAAPDAVLFWVKAPPGTYIGVVVHSLGREPVRFQAWGDELVALGAEQPGVPRAPCLRVRTLGGGAIVAAADPAAPPGFWAPAPSLDVQFTSGGRTLEPPWGAALPNGQVVFVAGLGELPEIGGADRDNIDLLQAAATVTF